MKKVDFNVCDEENESEDSFDFLQKLGTFAIKSLLSVGFIGLLIYLLYTKDNIASLFRIENFALLIIYIICISAIYVGIFVKKAEIIGHTEQQQETKLDLEL
jgi:hypothetical protein